MGYILQSKKPGLSVFEGSLALKLPTIWTDEKQKWEESEKRREEERRSKKRKSQKKEDPGARKGRKVAKHCVFPMICGSRRLKSRLAKAAGAEPAGHMRDEKLHACVARSTFPNQNVQNTPTWDHFSNLRCRKSARCCGAKRVSKSKCEKYQGFGPLLDVEASLCVAGARDCAPCQMWGKREGFVALPKTMAGVGHLKRICKRCIFRGRCGTWTHNLWTVSSHNLFLATCSCTLRGRCGTWRHVAALCVAGVVHMALG